MKTKILLTAVLCLVTSVASAATITVKLLDLGGAPSGFTTIGIYLKADAATSVYGISGAQIDVISLGTPGDTFFTGTTSIVGTNIGAFGYSKINAVAVDATNANESVAAMKPQPVQGLNDGDIDAVGFSFSTTPGNVDPTNVGAIGQTGGFELVAKERWGAIFLESNVTLMAYLTGAQYFADDTGNTFKDYDTVISIPLPAPEPASFVLMGLSGLVAICFAGRKVVC